MFYWMSQGDVWISLSRKFGRNLRRSEKDYSTQSLATSGICLQLIVTHSMLSCVLTRSHTWMSRLKGRRE